MFYTCKIYLNAFILIHPTGYIYPENGIRTNTKWANRIRPQIGKTTPTPHTAIQKNKKNPLPY